MSVETLADWLRCPACSAPLAALGGLVLGCVNGHRYDTNRRGYVTLLEPRSKVVGDSSEMLDARALVLERGTYSPIVAALRNALGALRPEARLLDAGTGTGYYLRSLLEPHSAARGLAMDLSPAAVARAVRGSEHIDGLVADTWRPLPVRDASADVILNVFAPRNLSEFHRILAPGGSLLVVVPRGDHLAQLRATGRMLDVPSDKAETLVAAAAELFALAERIPVVFEVPLDAALVQSLVSMGPSAHHTGTSGVGEAEPLGAEPLEAERPSVTEPPSVTVAVDVLRLKRR